jgi:hypothetical protein
LLFGELYISRYFKIKNFNMKKLRMIVTSVVVLAIVGSAFAFKAKKGAFCILDAAASGSTCTTYLQGEKIVTIGGTSFKYFPAWDGDGTACTASGNTLCTATFKLALD